MKKFEVEKDVGGIDGLLLIRPTIINDNRGYFMETYNKSEFEELGIYTNFVQDNQSVSKKNVLRGLHLHKNFPQAKLVRAIFGSVFDVVVDLRKDSATYGKWYSVVLSEDNQLQLYIPEGFAHGFYVLSDIAFFSFKVSDYWHAGDEIEISWDDPDLNIKWPIIDGKKPILFESDDN